jgi:hypothetical protein
LWHRALASQPKSAPEQSRKTIAGAFGSYYASHDGENDSTACRRAGSAAAGALNQDTGKVAWRQTLGDYVAGVTTPEA